MEIIIESRKQSDGFRVDVLDSYSAAWDNCGREDLLCDIAQILTDYDGAALDLLRRAVVLMQAKINEFESGKHSVGA